MASPAPSSHSHRAKAKPRQLSKHPKGAKAAKGKLVTQFVGGVTYHKVIVRPGKGVPKKIAKADSGELTDAQINAATARGEELARNEPRAQSAQFDRVNRKIVISFANGTEFSFPPEVAQGLESATDDQLTEVRLSGGGYGLHWDSLDADLTVPGLVNHVFGTRSFMAQQAGRATSLAKAAAARKNGARGGRPPKPTHTG
jgi:hypothetical protein